MEEGEALLDDAVREDAPAFGPKGFSGGSGNGSGCSVERRARPIIRCGEVEWPVQHESFGLTYGTEHVVKMHHIDRVIRSG